MWFHDAVDDLISAYIATYKLRLFAGKIKHNLIQAYIRHQLRIMTGVSKGWGSEDGQK